MYVHGELLNDCKKSDKYFSVIVIAMTKCVKENLNKTNMCTSKK